MIVTHYEFVSEREGHRIVSSECLSQVLSETGMCSGMSPFRRLLFRRLSFGRLINYYTTPTAATIFPLSFCLEFSFRVGVLGIGF